MHLLRPLSRSALAALLVASVSAIGAAPAGAATIKPIIFPVEGAVTYTDTFGACRGTACERRHEGQDLMGKRMMPLLAAVDGVVHRLVFNNTSSGGNSVTIKAADGWTYHYIHVNNDTPGTDDAKATRAQAFPPDVVVGARVTRGQVIAYMGDSGNAESTAPHLHFEIRQPPAPGSYTGTAINPYASLQAATHWATKQRWELRRTGSAGPGQDVFDFGVRSDDLPLLCDWDGDGVDEAVIYRAGIWYLRSGVASGSTVRSFTFGTKTDRPLCGNIDGDRADEPVLFATGGTWTMRTGFGQSDPIAWTARYGVKAADQPVMGDWDGNGLDDLAITREGTWHLRSGSKATGGTVRTFAYGSVPGDKPLSGDWDGNGKDDAAIYRKGRWYLRSSAEVTGGISASFTFGTAADPPVAGTWMGTARSGLGVLRRPSA